MCNGFHKINPKKQFTIFLCLQLSYRKNLLKSKHASLKIYFQSKKLFQIKKTKTEKNSTEKYSLPDKSFYKFETLAKIYIGWVFYAFPSPPIIDYD